MMWVMTLGPDAARAEAQACDRTAIIVSNNHATNARTPRLPLRLAEHTAEKLFDALVRAGAFRAECIDFLGAATRPRIDEAVTKAAQRVRAAGAGTEPTLFGFFFIGHGEMGRLLTAGDPMMPRDLQAMIRRVGASTSLMFIDACEAGSLVAPDLIPKGLTPTYNPLSKLDEDVLQTEGVIWMFSSGDGAPSYEIEKTAMTAFGGAFIASMRTTSPNDATIGLDALWHATRRETARRARLAGVEQYPVRYLSTRSGRVDRFAWRRINRTASVLLPAGRPGVALIRQGPDQITDWLSRTGESWQRFTVTPGVTEVIEYDMLGQVAGHNVFELVPGQTVTLGVTGGEPAPTAIVSVDNCDGVDNDYDGLIDEAWACYACARPDCLSPHEPRSVECEMLRSDPLIDVPDLARWSLTELEGRLLNGRLKAYRIEGHMAADDQWFVPGANDLLNDGTRAWTLFAHRTHEAVVCNR